MHVVGRIISDGGVILQPVQLHSNSINPKPGLKPGLNPGPNPGFNPGVNHEPGPGNKPGLQKYLYSSLTPEINPEPEKDRYSVPKRGPGTAAPEWGPGTARKIESQKRKVDESTPRIDVFLQTSAKKKKDEPALKPKTKTVSATFNLGECRRRIKAESVKDGLVGSILTEKGVSLHFFYFIHLPNILNFSDGFVEKNV